MRGEGRRGEGKGGEERRQRVEKEEMEGPSLVALCTCQGHWKSLKFLATRGHWGSIQL